MNEYNESILIQEGEIDLRHLADILKNENIHCVYEATREGFISSCKARKYNAIILTLTGQTGLGEEIIKAISWSQNLFTPVMVVTPECDPDLTELLLKYKFEYLRFPFLPGEFIFRIRRAIRLKQNEEIVHSNLLKYRTLCDNFPVGIAQTDQYGKFEGVNPAFADFMNMSEPDLFRENFFQLCHPDDYFILRKQLDRLLRREIRIVNFEIRLINNDGKTAVCKVVANSMWENDTDFSSFTFVIEKIN